MGQGTIGGRYLWSLGERASRPLKSAGDARSLSHQTDAALYWAKGHGRTDVQRFDRERHGLEADHRSTPELADAVGLVARRGLMTPTYQPIFDLRTGSVVGFEGLVRPTERAASGDVSAVFVAAEAVELGLEAGQGYLLGPPSPEIRIERLDLGALLEAHAARRRAM